MTTEVSNENHYQTLSEVVFSSLLQVSTLTNCLLNFDKYNKKSPVGLWVVGLFVGVG